MANTPTYSLGTDRTVTGITAFLERLLPPPRPFDLRFWNGTVLPGDGKPHLTIVINSPGAVRSISLAD